MKRKTESSSVGVLPPDQVTDVDCACRFHPGDGSYESIAKPLGTVSSIVVVVAPSFSVGTDRVNCWSFPFSATGGLIVACADAPAATTSAAVPASASTPIRLLRVISSPRST